MNLFSPLLSSLLIVWCMSSYGAGLDLLHGNEGSYRAQGLGEHKNSCGEIIFEKVLGLFSIVYEKDGNLWWLKVKFVYDKKMPFSFVLQHDGIEKYLKAPIMAKDENDVMVKGVSFQLDSEGQPHPLTEKLHNFKSCFQFKFTDKKLTALRIQYLDNESVTHVWEITNLRLPGSDRKTDWDF